MPTNNSEALTVTVATWAEENTHRGSQSLCFPAWSVDFCGHGVPWLKIQGNSHSVRWHANWKPSTQRQNRNLLPYAPMATCPLRGRSEQKQAKQQKARRKGIVPGSKPRGIISRQGAQKGIFSGGGRRHSFPDGTLPAPAFRPSATAALAMVQHYPEPQKTWSRKARQRSSRMWINCAPKSREKTTADTQKAMDNLKGKHCGMGSNPGWSWHSKPVARMKGVVWELNPDRTRKLCRQIDACSIQLETKHMAPETTQQALAEIER